MGWANVASSSGCRHLPHKGETEGCTGAATIRSLNITKSPLAPADAEIERRETGAAMSPSPLWGGWGGAFRDALKLRRTTLRGSPKGDTSS
jgi:hypothetical protein